MDKGCNQYCHRRDHKSNRRCEKPDGFPQHTADPAKALHLRAKGHDPFSKGCKAGHGRTDRTDHLSQNQKKRPDRRRQRQYLDDRFALGIAHGIEFIDKALYRCDHLPDDRHEQIAEGNGELLQLGLQDGQLARQVILHDFRHGLCRAIAVIDRAGQLIKILIGCIDNGKPARHGVFSEDRRSCRRLLGFGQAAHLLPEGDHRLTEIDGAVIIFYKGDVVSVHVGLHLLRRFRKVGKTRPERCACLRRLDTGVCHQAQRYRGILCADPEGTGDWRGVFKGLAEHRNVRVCIGAGSSKDIREVARVFCRQAKCGQRIRHDIGCGTQILAGCSGQVHDALDAFQHIFGLPTGHRHVLEGFPGFRSGELGLTAHLPGFGSQVVKLLPGCAGDGLHLAHLRIEICRCLHSGSAKSHDRSRDLHGQVFPDACDLIAGLLELLTGLIDLFKFGIGRGNLGFQLLERLLSLFDLPLQSIVFILPQRPLFQLFLCLLLSGFQGIQLILGGPDGFL